MQNKVEISQYKPIFISCPKCQRGGMTYAGNAWYCRWCMTTIPDCSATAIKKLQK